MAFGQGLWSVVGGFNQSKTLVAVGPANYGGDASQLSDIVRATLEFKMHPDVLEDMYKAVEYMVYASELNGCRVTVTLFHDRFRWV